MTKTEKETLYNLLKTISQSVNGYETEKFSKANPLFSDDISDSQNISVQAAGGINQGDFSSLQKNSTENTKSVSIASVAERIASCTRCGLCKTRTNVVPGMGIEKPAVLVVGEGPGYEEDKQALPFVGNAGQLLDKMLAAISLSRKQNCYIANIVKCRPPENRDPSPDEISACYSFLEAQINILKPKMILAMGRIASQTLLKTNLGINAVRGKLFDYNGIPLMATYHPSALLRNAELKAPAWQDLKAFKAKLLTIVPDYEAGFSKE